MARFFPMLNEEGFASGATTYDEQLPGGRFTSSHIIVPHANLRLCLSAFHTSSEQSSG